MYRTDKQFMKNPATAPSRIYIGNLAETVVPSSLEEKFALHGKILGLVVQRGFGFIQFENEAQAKSAITNEHGTNFYGRKINVKQAIDNTKSKPTNQQQSNTNNQNNFQKNQSTTPQKDEQKSQNETNDSSKPFIGPQQPATQQNQLQNAQATKQNENAPQKQNQQDDALPPENRFNKRNKGRQPMKRDFRGDVPSSYYDQVPPYNNTYQPPILDRPERNDCEIIVLSKALTAYAEFIEQQLKSLGLIVDLLFPNEDVPIGRVLANISSRGCLYAILVMPQNEEHRSLTLNILHGIPEEHRNMPIEDAFVLIIKNFESYMRGEKYGSKVDSDKMTLTSKHPENMQVIINLIAENRQVTTSQYDKLISYLQEKRDVQSQFEISEGIDTGIEPESKSKQAELQSRIMNILNKKADDVPLKIVEPESNSTPLLNDPSVQKALDSLMLGDMFKGLAS